MLKTSEWWIYMVEELIVAIKQLSAEPLPNGAGDMLPEDAGRLSPRMFQSAGQIGTWPTQRQ